MAQRKWPTGIQPHGSGIRIRLSRGGKYIYSETVEGNPYSPGDLAAAVRRRDHLRSRLKLGMPLYDGEDSQHKLFSEAAQSYMNTLDADYSTHITYERIINRYWLPVFGSLMCTDISPKMIKLELSKLAVSQKTKKNILIPLRGILNHEEINPNPVAAIKLKRHQSPPVERFTPEERSEVLARLSGQPLVYFAILFSTGLRPGEALALEWSDYRDGMLEVSKTVTARRLKRTTKTHERRSVYVPRWARAIIREHATRFEGGFILQNQRGDHYRDTDIFNDAWRAALKAIRAPYRVPYACRHTRAAELLSTGVEPAEAARQLGHTLEMFFRAYAEWIEDYSRNRDYDKLEGYENGRWPKNGPKEKG